jgi:glycosyltransferase involved in cell wall biosynthesis
VRIAIFSETYHQINGVAMVYNRFAKWCADRGYEVHIFTPGKSGTIELGSVRVVNVPMRLPIPYYRGLHFDLIPNFKFVRNYFSHYKFDLVHIATQGHAGLLGMRIANRMKIPYVSCYHTAVPEYAYDRFVAMLGNNFFGRFFARIAKSISWWFQEIIYRRSKLMFVPTKSIQEVVEQHLEMPTAIWSRGVDSKAFSPEKRKSGDSSEVKTIYAGRISIEKNLALLKKLKLDHGKGMTFVGDGPYLDNLKRAMPEAEFTGFLVGEPLQEAYASADIFVFPSKTDTFGNAVLEAMSSGLPVVVTNILGPKDFVIHGETGFIAKSDEEFVEYHAELCNNHELRKTMGANARNYALSQSWDHVFEQQVVERYRQILQDQQQTKG